MLELYPLVIFYGIIVYSFFSSRPVLIYMFFGSMPFGSLAVIPPEIIGGLTLTPTPIISILLILKTFFNKSNTRYFFQRIAPLKPTKFLFFFLLVALFTTYFGPRLFQDAIDVIPLRGLLNVVSPLEPTPQNFSQFTFLFISVLSVFAFACILRNEKIYKHSFGAIVFGSIVLIFTGTLDQLTQFLDFDSFLEPYRTATYALAVDVEVLDQKRVVGLMPEASAFGGLCLFFLVSIYFFRSHSCSIVFQKKSIAFVLVALIVMIWISTSSSAYVGLGVFLLSALLHRVHSRHLRVKSRVLFTSNLLVDSLLLGIAVFMLLLVILIEANFAQGMYEMFDRMVLQKSQSHSFEERGFWRKTAYDAITGTYGFGVGVGSTRSSNTFFAVFSQTGLLGGLFYYTFIAQLVSLRHYIGVPSTHTVRAFRWILVTVFALDAMVGSTADFGPFLAYAYGLLLASMAKRQFHKPPPN